jgi:hypothetical protein
MRFYPKNSILTMLFVLLALQTVAQKPYHGAEVYSKDAVLYGKFVMRMKMAKGSGMLSTFFTFKGNSHETGVFWEELDIEVFGKENATILGTNIITDGVDGPTSHSSQDVYLNYSLADDYHTYTLEWTPDYVAWFIDGVEYRRVTGGVVSSLTSPQSYRFNAWISCSPEWVGPIDAQRLPQFQKVDWIEYHSYNNGQFELEWRDDFQTFDDSRWAKANWTFDCNEVDFTADNVSIVDGKLVLAITDPADQPVADAGADHTVCDEDRNGFESVLLDGSKSIASSGGSIQNYEWFAGGTLIGEGEILEHEFGEGEQIVSLKITDNYSNTATDKVVVKVQPCLFTLLSDSELPDGVTYMATNWYSLADENSSVAEVQMVTGGADDTSKGAMISYSGIGGGSACE